MYLLRDVTALFPLFSDDLEIETGKWFSDFHMTY